MYFLYLKSTGNICEPIHSEQPSQQAINKEKDCELGSGIKWENVDLFFAPDNEFPEDFARTAPLGKYYIDIDNVDIHKCSVKENLEWQEPEEEERF